MLGENLRPPRKGASSPQWSITTIKSLDISSNIPKVVENMEAEDSPWGGQTTHCKQELLSLAADMRSQTCHRGRVLTATFPRPVNQKSQVSCDRYVWEVHMSNAGKMHPRPSRLQLQPFQRAPDLELPPDEDLAHQEHPVV